MRDPDRWQEPDRLPLRWLLGPFAAVVVLSVALGGLAALCVGQDEHVYRPSGSFPEAHLGPRAPRAGVLEDLYEGRSRWTSLRAAQRAELVTYGWVDRERRMVSIPIEDAMDLYAAGARP